MCQSNAVGKRQKRRRSQNCTGILTQYARYRRIQQVYSILQGQRSIVNMVIFGVIHTLMMEKKISLDTSLVLLYQKNGFLLINLIRLNLKSCINSTYTDC